MAYIAFMDKGGFGVGLRGRDSQMLPGPKSFKDESMLKG